MTFGSRPAGWPVGPIPPSGGQRGTAAFVGGRYRVAVSSAGLAVPAAAPIAAAKVTGDISVSATARLATGQGGWGVWCRGTSLWDSNRYEFTVTRDGVAYIVTPDHRGDEDDPAQIPGFDAGAEHTVSAECVRLPAGAGMRLTMKVDGAEVATWVDIRATLPPAGVGVHSFAYGDVPGPLADARFSSFDVTRAG